MPREIKLTENLHWSSLKENFFIGTRTCEELERDASGKIVLKNGNPTVIKVQRTVNELQDAIDNGTLDNLVAEAARIYHDGDTQEVLAAMAKVLDSKRCNLKKATGYAPTKPVDELRLDLLTAYVKSRRIAKTRSSEGLPQWAFGPAEIDAIDDAARLQKVINSINDVCCGKAAGSYTKYLGEDYMSAAKANREYARTRKAALEAKAAAPVIEPALLAKLSKGQKTVLTAAQTEALLKLLGR